MVVVRTEGRGAAALKVPLSAADDAPMKR